MKNMPAHIARFLIMGLVTALSLTSFAPARAKENAALSATPDWFAHSFQANSHYGTSVATAGDVNGDGFSDLVTGAPDYDNGETDEGRVYVYYGSISGLNPSPDWYYEGDIAGRKVGSSVNPAGDVNGDGYADVVVGTDMNHAMVFYGSSTGLPSTPDWIQSGDGSEGFGRSVNTAGDVNGDGYSDVMIGAPGSFLGRVYVYRGSSTGLSTTANSTFTGPSEINQDGTSGYGSSVSLAGDVNGDGYGDIIVGAPYADRRVCAFYCTTYYDIGRFFIYLGTASGLSGTAYSYLGTGEHGHTGISVAAAGDVNGDGYADVLIGSDKGEAYAHFGFAGGLNASPNWTVTGASGSGFGHSIGTAGDVNGDGFSDVVVGAYLYDNVQVDRGAIFVYHGSNSGIGTAPVWSEEGGQDSGQLGYAVGVAGDVNGDGYTDIVTGANLYDAGQPDTGAAFVFHGNSDGLPGASSWTVDGEQAANYFGGSIGDAGDVNGDGYADFLVGAGKYDGTETDEGKAYLYYGSSTGPSTTAGWTIEGNQVDAGMGAAVSGAGDVNGDGYDDILVASIDYDHGETDEGIVWLFLGSPTGPASTPDWTAENNQAASRFGTSATSAGDVNGDGYADIIIGSPHFDGPLGDGQGAAYVYYGSAAGPSTLPDWNVVGEKIGIYLGVSVGTAGDVNGDGYSDVAVGAPYYYTRVDLADWGNGRAYIYYGSADGLSTIPNWYADPDLPTESRMGGWVGTAGDVNGDGYSDALIGAYGYGSGTTHRGKIHVYYGSSSGVSSTPSWSYTGDQDGGVLSASSGTLGDINGDGYSDVIVGAGNYDDGETDEGRVYAFYGTSAGLSTSPGWTVNGDQAETHLGSAVSPAGDVNGDGYSDALVSAAYFDTPDIDAGRVYLYYGNGTTGVGLIPRQQKNVGTPLASLGKSDGLTSFRLAALGRSPYGRGDVKLEWEVKPLGTPFTGSGLQRSSSWIDSGTAGAALSELVSGLASNANYHWRARLLYHPTTTPYQQYSRWITNANNGWQEKDLLLGNLSAANPPLFEKTLWLDGIDDYAVASDNPSIDLGAGLLDDFTIDAWFYVPNTINTSTDVLIWKDQAYSLYIDFNTSAADEVYFDIWQDASHLFRLQTSVNFSQGWHHIAGTFSNEATPTADTYSLYLNGNRINTSTHDFPLGINNSTSILRLGLNGGWDYYGGWLEEIRFSNNVRYGGTTYTVPSDAFTVDGNTNALWHFNDAWAYRLIFDDDGYYNNYLSGLNGAQIGNPYSTPPLPADFEKIAPSHASIDQSTSPTLSWQSSTEAASYEYCYYSVDPSDCDEPWALSTAYTSVALSGLSFSTTYHWQVRAVNAGGFTSANAGTWWSFTTTWENHSPLANPGGPYSADLGSSLSLDGSASSDPDAPAGDSLASFEWDLDEDGVFELTGPTPTVSSAQVDTLGTGDHPISLRVTDSRGATGTAVTTLSIFDNRPVASFTASPNPAACGQSVSFDASGSSHLKPGRSIVTFAWDFGDGQTTTGPIVDHSFSAFGSYSVTLTVTDDNLPARTDEETVIVNINLGNQPPTANAGGPYQVVVGALLNLDGTASSDPDAACGDSLTAFEWDLDNDGEFDDATGSTPSTTFSTPGDHTVALRVQDEFGATSTDTAVVTVLPLTPDAFDKMGPVGWCDRPVHHPDTIMGRQHRCSQLRVLLLPGGWFYL